MANKTAICKQCGKRFKPNKPKQIYCSAKCRKLAYKKTNVVFGETLYCVVCGKPFKRKSWNQMYCSLECRKKDDRNTNPLSWYELELLLKEVKKGRISRETFEKLLDKAKRKYLKRGSEKSLEILLSLEKKYKSWKEGKKQ